MTLKLSAKDRAYLTGFVLGHCLAYHEAGRELHAVRGSIQSEVDDLRAENARVIAQLREQWGLPEQQLDPAGRGSDRTRESQDGDVA